MSYPQHLLNETFTGIHEGKKTVIEPCNQLIENAAGLQFAR